MVQDFIHQQYPYLVGPATCQLLSVFFAEDLAKPSASVFTLQPALEIAAILAGSLRCCWQGWSHPKPLKPQTSMCVAFLWACYIPDLDDILRLGSRILLEESYQSYLVKHPGSETSNSEAWVSYCQYEDYQGTIEGGHKGPSESSA